ncbi:hypothetical protein ACFX2K_007493 [Malus domestica]
MSSGKVKSSIFLAASASNRIDPVAPSQSAIPDEAVAELSSAAPAAGGEKVSSEMPRADSSKTTSYEQQQLPNILGKYPLIFLLVFKCFS